MDSYKVRTRLLHISPSCSTGQVQVWLSKDSSMECGVHIEELFTGGAGLCVTVYWVARCEVYH